MVGGPLQERDLDPDPFVQFQAWFAHARAAGQVEPEAMALATASATGVPSVRFVLLRGFDERGFVFYTNSHSRKGQEMAANPTAALVFRWQQVDRQVRLAGPVTPIADAESDAYFAGRERGSQLGAWASEQSSPLETRLDLELRVREAANRFSGSEVPRPPWWGGYRVSPSEIEFWQQGADRLHDRFRYVRAAGGGWALGRLSP